MNSLEVYKKCVIDLDKYDTPTFEIVDFNRYAERALYEFVNEKYKEFETFQKRTDDLRQFVKFVEITTNNLDNIDLPIDYLRLLKVDFLIDYDGCSEEEWVIAKKTTADKLGYSQENYYWKPSLFNPQYQIIGNKIYIRIGKDSVTRIKSIRLEYLHIPSIYYINEGDLSDYTTPIYTDEIDMQIIDKVVRIFQSITNPSIYQVSLQESTLKNN